MAWTRDQLRDFYQLPQADAVLDRALTLAEGHVDRANPDLIANGEESRRDDAVAQIVQIYVYPPDYSGNVDGGVLVQSQRDAIADVLLSIVSPVETIGDPRPPIFQPVWR